MIETNHRALRAFVSRDLSDLAGSGGLPTGLTLGTVAAALGADPDVSVRWFLGDPPTETFWCPATGIAGFDDRIRIWFRAGVVVKVDGEWPELAPGVTDALGPPELRLDHRMDVTLIKGGEHVWASRGVAVKLNSSETIAVELSVFASTTPTRYREDLQDVDEYRESPPPAGKGKS